MTHKKNKLSASSINRSEGRRTNVDFDDAISVRPRGVAPRVDDRDSREDLVWELDSFKWERN